MKKPASFQTVMTISAQSAVSRLPSQLLPPRPKSERNWSISP